MRTEDDKYKVERIVLIEFAKNASLNLDQESMRKGNPDIGEPDIFCNCNAKFIYFELAEACVKEFAAAIAEAKRNESGLATAWGSDGIEEVLNKKLKKSYNVKEPIDLLLYLNGRNALPDDVLIPKALHLLKNGAGPFRKVWFFGETVCELDTGNS